HALVDDMLIHEHDRPRGALGDVIEDFAVQGRHRRWRPQHDQHLVLAGADRNLLECSRRQDIALLELLAGATRKRAANQDGSRYHAQARPARKKAALDRGRLGHCGTGPVLLEPASPAMAGSRDLRAFITHRGSAVEPAMLWPFNHFRK